MDGLQWKTLLKLMIWGAHPYFWKLPPSFYFHDYGRKSIFHPFVHEFLFGWNQKPSVTTPRVAAVPMPTIRVTVRKTIEHMGVSKNNGTPKSSILIGFSIVNHPFWGTPIFGNTHIFICTRLPVIPCEDRRIAVWTPQELTHLFGGLNKHLQTEAMTGATGDWKPTWSIIPVSKWLKTMVSKSPKWGYSPCKWPKWLVNRGY